MSPKSLLRHKSAVSTLEEISSGTFKNVIDDEGVLSLQLSNSISPSALPSLLTSNSITRIVLCSGKVYYDLLDSKQQNQLNHIAIIRLEQLYPFPEKELQEIIDQYTNAVQIVWCQEEPRNQGAWYSIRHHFESLLQDYASKIEPSKKKQSHNFQPLIYAGRIASAAPAVGVARIHVAQQKKLVNQALGFENEEPV